MPGHPKVTQIDDFAQQPDSHRWLFAVLDPSNKILTRLSDELRHPLSTSLLRGVPKGVV